MGKVLGMWDNRAGVYHLKKGPRSKAELGCHERVLGLIQS